MSRRTQNRSRLVRILIVLLYRKRFTLTVSALVLAAMITGVCYYEWEVEPVRIPEPRSWSSILASDTLRVVTVPSSYTAFEYKGKWYGHEYENARQVSQALGLELSLLVVDSEQAAADSLFTGAADLAILPMEYQLVEGHWFLRPTGPRWSESQSIVSVRKLDYAVEADSLLMDSLMVRRTDYHMTCIEGDSLTVEQRVDSMMQKGQPEAMVLRSNVARLMHDFYPKMVIADTIEASCDSLAWMVTAGADTLRHMIDSVSLELIDNVKPHYTVAIKVYRDKRRQRTHRRAEHFVMRDGALSPYDDVFRQKAEAYELDWRLLAGIAYIESNFNHEIVSSRGPIGLMQLMPQTVRSYGYTTEEALNAEVNVEIAAQLMSRLLGLVHNRVPGISDDDAICYALAGYNAGLGHVYDAIRLAETLGYNPKVWRDNVEHCLRLKADPQYYKMSVVKSGRFNGAFTINYVNEVTSAYHTFCSKVAKD